MRPIRKPVACCPRLRPLALAAALLCGALTGAGCVSDDLESGIRIGDETLDQFEAGETRESWLLAILGEPTSRSAVADEPGTEVLRYSTLQEADRGFFASLLGNAPKENVATIYFVLRSGVVERFWADRKDDGGLFGGKSGEKAD